MRTRIKHGDHSGDASKPRFKIETLEDYELATQRIAALDRSTRSEDGDQERDALVDAVKNWDAGHDDATRWED